MPSQARALHNLCTSAASLCNLCTYVAWLRKPPHACAQQSARLSSKQSWALPLLPFPHSSLIKLLHWAFLYILWSALLHASQITLSAAKSPPKLPFFPPDSALVLWGENSRADKTLLKTTTTKQKCIFSIYSSPHFCPISPKSLIALVSLTSPLVLLWTNLHLPLQGKKPRGTLCFGFGVRAAFRCLR